MVLPNCSKSLEGALSDQIVVMVVYTINYTRANPNLRFSGFLRQYHQWICATSQGRAQNVPNKSIDTIA